jgi:hypothetical protein
MENGGARSMTGVRMAIGEPCDITSLAHHGKTLTETQAIGMLLLLQLRYTKLQGVLIKFSNRETRKTRGYAHGQKREIVLNKSGMNEGTLLHEAAHFIAGCNRGHDEKFKQTLRELYQYWEERNGGSK